MLVLIDQVP